MAMAKGRSRLGCFISLAAKPTLFQASMENSEPTMAAPITVSGTTAPPVAQKLRSEVRGQGVGDGGRRPARAG